MRVERCFIAAAWLFVSARGFVASAEMRFTDLRPEEKRYLEEFSTAFLRFKGMSLDEFLGAFGSKKQFLTGSDGSFVRGDANRDRGVNLGDAVCVLTFLFGGGGPCAQVECLDAMDTNDSGGVDVSDVVALLDFLFRDGAEPAVPYPSAGRDPTADALACPSRQKLSYEPTEAQYLTEIFNAYLPTVRQEDAFREHGFVIYKNVKYESMLRGYFEIYRRDLPVYITVDSILDALHLSFDRMLMDLEQGVLSRELSAMLSAMEAGLDAVRAEADAQGVALDGELQDAATWICVARSLLAGEKIACLSDTDAATSAILAQVAAKQIDFMSLFGSSRREDFSQFTIRGHYTKTVELGRYFQAMMWVQRVGMALAEPRLSREARVAWLLTRLLDAKGPDGIAAGTHWTTLNDAILRLVGLSDSANPPAMKEFMEQRGLSFASLVDEEPFQQFAQSAIAAGLGRQRINSTLLMTNPVDPACFTPFPPLFHMMGQRFTVESFTFQNVTYDRVGGRLIPSPLDAMFVLGNRDALALLEPELRTYGYQANLAALDWIVSSYDPDFTLDEPGGGGTSNSSWEPKAYPTDFWTSSLYNVWLSALRTLNQDTTDPRYPEVMRTETWSQRVLNTQLASWAHQRHDFILYSKESYPPDGCVYPTGWVDPYPEFYETLREFSAKAREVFSPISGKAEACFSAFEAVCEQLAAISRAELSGAELGESQGLMLKTWLTQRVGGCGWGPENPPERTEPFVFDGWYARMIYRWPDPTVGGGGLSKGEEFDPTIASVHTVTPDPTRGPQILHVGAGHPNLALITVKTDCGVRAYAGPVLSYHEFVEPSMHRWTDEEWKAELEAGADKRPAWTRSFVK